MMQVCEIYNFNQDDLMTEDVYILDCHTNIFLWVGQEVPSKTKTQALAIGQVRFDHFFINVLLESQIYKDFACFGI